MSNIITYNERIMLQLIEMLYYPHKLDIGLIIRTKSMLRRIINTCINHSLFHHFYQFQVSQQITIRNY